MSCRSLEVVDSTLTAADLGAQAIRSVEHADPFVRYDVFVFESREAADESGARDAIKAQLPPTLGADVKVQVSAVGGSLFVARSFVADVDGEPSGDTAAILNHYSQRIAGAE